MRVLLALGGNAMTNADGRARSEDQITAAEVAMDAVADRVVSVGIHPGWVRTDMGGADADIGVSESVCAMRGVIDKLMPSDNGSFRDYHGRPIPW